MDKELLEIVFDNVYNGIYLTDGKGVTLRVNRTFEEMSGISNDELAGKRLQDLVGENKLFTGSATLLVLERKAPATVTYSTRAGRKLLVRGKPIFDDQGRIRYVVNTVWDLTVVNYQKEIDSDTARDHLLAEEDIIACSESMMEIVDLALRVANTDSTVLITGETGVGKSLIARLIHRTSERGRNMPLCQINCAAIPETLIESELFGYEAGSFTGADRRGRPGLFETADGGTIFLDEISELPLHLQSKLLGVIQDREFYKVGGRRVRSVDVRIIAATNRELAPLVAAGKFRADLFYRLNVVPIHVPPLRERPEDISSLIRYFVDKYNRKYRRYRRISPDVVECLQGQPWPGNVRELENYIERIIVTSGSEEITSRGTGLCEGVGEFREDLSLKEALAEQERSILLQALRRYGTTRRVARALGISQASAARKLKEIRGESGEEQGGERTAVQRRE